MELTPKGTRGTGMPSRPRPMMKVVGHLMVWFGRRAGEGTVIITTMGAKSGNPHAVALGRFPDRANSFLVVASNGGSAQHPAWFINMAKKPDQVWAEVGRRNVRVRPELLKGAEREAAWRRVVAYSPGYARYQTDTDREIPLIRLVPEDSADASFPRGSRAS